MQIQYFLMKIVTSSQQFQIWRFLSIKYINKISTMKILALCLALVNLATQHEYLDQAAIIADVKSLRAQWEAGHNSYFDGKSIEEIKTLMGTILETPEHLKLPVKEITPLEALPETFDPREQWPGCESIKQVRDQSTCGSCWAFGAAEAMSDRICIQSGQKDQTRISSEDLLTCCGMNCGNGCNGGYPSGAWNHFKNTGLVTGYLYNDKKWCSSYAFAPCDHHTTGTYGPCGASKPTPSCKKQCTLESGKTYSSDVWQADTVYSLPSNVEKIQTELMTHGPIQVAFTVYEDFLTYKSGVYHHTSGKALGGHAVKMIGWGVENGSPYWLVANSWNEGWGDKGFFKIKRGSNECGIESQGVAGTIKMKKQMTQQDYELIE